MARNFTVDIPIGAWLGDTGPVTAGDLAALPVLAGSPAGPALEFKDGSAEYAALTQYLVVSDEYTGSGTLKLAIYWCAAVSSGKVNWEVYAEANGSGDSVGSASFDTVNDDGGTTVPGSTYVLAETVITLTNKDSVSAGDLLRLLLRRDSDDGTNDTAAGSAYFLGAELYEEV